LVTRVSAHVEWWVEPHYLSAVSCRAYCSDTLLLNLSQQNWLSLQGHRLGWDARRLALYSERVNITSLALCAISIRWRQWQNSTNGLWIALLQWNASLIRFSPFETFVTISRNGKWESQSIDSFATPVSTNPHFRTQNGVLMIMSRLCKLIIFRTFSWLGKILVYCVIFIGLAPHFPHSHRPRFFLHISVNCWTTWLKPRIHE
jgi:hypothetical protein